MKKLAATLFCVLLLGGCAISEEDLPNEILSRLEQIPTMQLTAGSNMKKRYYSYYLPAGIKRRDSNELSEVFMKNGYRLVMNFDPSAIVIENFYKEKEETKPIENTVEKDDTIVQPQMKNEANKYMYTGNYLTSDGHVEKYTLQVIESDQQYLLYMDGGVIKFYTYVPRAEITSSLKAVVTIMTSIKYDDSLILQAYSMRSLENTKKKNINYLEQNLPASGSLKDLLYGKDENSGAGSADSTE